MEEIPKPNQPSPKENTPSLAEQLKASMEGNGLASRNRESIMENRAEQQSKKAEQTSALSGADTLTEFGGPVGAEQVVEKLTKKDRMKRAPKPENEGGDGGKRGKISQKEKKAAPSGNKPSEQTQEEAASAAEAGPSEQETLMAGAQKRMVEIADAVKAADDKGIDAQTDILKAELGKSAPKIAEDLKKVALDFGDRKKKEKYEIGLSLNNYAKAVETWSESAKAVEKNSPALLTYFQQLLFGVRQLEENVIYFKKAERPAVRKEQPPASGEKGKPEENKSSAATPEAPTNQSETIVPLNPKDAQKYALKTLFSIANENDPTDFSRRSETELPGVALLLRRGAESLEQMDKKGSAEAVASLRALADSIQSWHSRISEIRTKKDSRYNFRGDFRKNVLKPVQGLPYHPKYTNSESEAVSPVPEASATSPATVEAPAPAPTVPRTDFDVEAPDNVIDETADRETAPLRPQTIASTPIAEAAKSGTKLKTSYEIVEEKLKALDEERKKRGEPAPEVTGAAGRSAPSAETIPNIRKRAEAVPELNPDDIVGSAFNAKGFTEFYATTEAAARPENSSNPDVIKAYYEAFKYKAAAAEGLKALYQERLKKEIGVAIDSKVLAQIDAVMEGRARGENPEFVKILNDNLAAFKELPEKIKIQEAQLAALKTSAAEAKTKLEALEAQKKDLEPFKDDSRGLLSRYIRTFWAVAWETEERLTKKRDKLVVGSTGWNDLDAKVKKLQAESDNTDKRFDVEDKYGIRPDFFGNGEIERALATIDQTIIQIKESQLDFARIELEKLRAEEGLESIRHAIFNGSTLSGEIVAAAREAAGKQLRVFVDKGSFQEASKYLEGVEKASAQGELGIDYLEGAFKDITAVKERLTANAQLEVAQSMIKAVDSFKHGANDLTRFTDAIKPFLSVERVGSLSGEESREFVLNELRKQWRKFNRAKDPRAVLLANACARLIASPEAGTKTS